LKTKIPPAPIEELEKPPVETISKDEFEKLAKERDELSAKANELEGKFSQVAKELESFRNEKLKAEGNKDELIKHLEEKLSNEKRQYEADLSKFKFAKVIGAFREAAAKEGCLNLDDVQKLYADSLKSVKVNPTTFDADQDSLKQIISQAKEKSSYLFTKPAPRVDDINLKNEKDNTSIKANLRKVLF
jgi:hypothetical protein